MVADLMMKLKSSHQNASNDFTVEPSSSSIELDLDNVVCNTTHSTSEQFKKDGKLLEQVAVVPIDCTFNIVTEQTLNTMPVLPTMNKVELKRTRGKVTIVFAIRSPGCIACRLHAMQLKELCETKYPDVALVGIIKETGMKHNNDILDFYQKYFQYPIYKDTKWSIYKNVLGNRRLSIVLALWRWKKLVLRAKQNNVTEGIAAGEAYTLGGILILDKYGTVHYKYNEQFGIDLNLIDIENAITNARNVSGKKGISVSTKPIKEK